LFSDIGGKSQQYKGSPALFQSQIVWRDDYTIWAIFYLDRFYSAQGSATIGLQGPYDDEFQKARSDYFGAERKAQDTHFL
jgi:hypothetical protein